MVKSVYNLVVIFLNYVLVHSYIKDSSLHFNKARPASPSSSLCGFWFLPTFLYQDHCFTSQSFFLFICFVMVSFIGVLDFFIGVNLEGDTKEGVAMSFSMRTSLSTGALDI
ncbi:hypothetical protein AgCh_006981 [Apium graveolens]